MNNSDDTPHHIWEAPVPAEVFACLIPGEMRITLFPGIGQASYCSDLDVPMSVIPFELRMPNTRLWVQLDEKMNAVRVWRREA
jgi:hypothetical protein